MLDTATQDSKSYSDFWQRLGIHPHSFDHQYHPNLFCDVISHEFVLSSLIRQLRQSHPITLLTGPAGVGKTTIIHRLQKSIPSQYNLLHIHATQGTTRQNIIKPITTKCYIPAIGPHSKSHEVTSILLDALSQQSNRLLMIIDDAHQLPWESLALLVQIATALEATMQFKLLLCGEPECTKHLDMLQPPSQDRPSSYRHFQLRPLSFLDMGNYITQRLLRAGSEIDVDRLTPVIMKRLYAQTAGVPHQIHKAFQSYDFLSFLESALTRSNPDTTTDSAKTNSQWQQGLFWFLVITIALLAFIQATSALRPWLTSLQVTTRNAKSLTLPSTAIPSIIDHSNQPSTPSLSQPPMQAAVLPITTMQPPEREILSDTPHAQPDSAFLGQTAISSTGETSGDIPQAKAKDVAQQHELSGPIYTHELLPSHQFYIQLMSLSDMNLDRLPQSLLASTTPPIIAFTPEHRALVLMGPFEVKQDAVNAINRHHLYDISDHPWIRSSDDINSILT